MIFSDVKYVIYVLVDPRFKGRSVDEVKYVGYTNDLDHRFNNHLVEARSSCDCRKCRWIRSLFRDDVIPEIREVDWGYDVSKWGETETYWIRFYREEVGADLTNLTDGGYGALGYRFSDESRRLRSERNRQPEMVERRSRSLSSFLKNLKTIDPEAFADRVGHLTRHTSRTNVTRCLEGRCGHKSHQHRRILCEAA